MTELLYPSYLQVDRHRSRTFHLSFLTPTRTRHPTHLVPMNVEYSTHHLRQRKITAIPTMPSFWKAEYHCSRLTGNTKIQIMVNEISIAEPAKQNS